MKETFFGIGHVGLVKATPLANAGHRGFTLKFLYLPFLITNRMIDDLIDVVSKVYYCNLFGVD
jgi:hypothetical protein